MAENDESVEFFNMPLAKDDDDPYVGAGQEYVNSADVIGKPIIPEDDDARKYYEDAIADQRALTTVVSAYGVAPSEVDPETGEKKEGITRMGESPDADQPVEKAVAPTSDEQAEAIQATDQASSTETTTATAPPAPAPAQPDNTTE